VLPADDREAHGLTGELRRAAVMSSKHEHPTAHREK
jgi:hypothetical protein